MTAKIELDLQRLRGPLTGMRGVELLVNDEAAGPVAFGQTVTVDVDPGRYVVQTQIHGILKRKSKKLKVEISKYSTAKLAGKYSRFWGNIQLSENNA